MSDAPVVFSPAGARAIEETVGIVRGNVRDRPDRWGHGGGFLPPGGRIRFKNESSETVPSGGVMRITGADYSAGYVNTAKPNASRQQWCLINIGDATPPSKWGDEGSFLTSLSRDFDENLCSFDDADTPAFGEIWGPQDDEWTLKKDHPGFIIIGGNTGSGSSARVIAVQQQTPLWGKPDSSYSADGTGTATLWDRAFSGSLGLTVSSVIFRTRDVTTATRVSITPDGVAFPIDCEDA